MEIIKSNCGKWRNSWEEIQNLYFEKNNIQTRVSLKSFEKQNSDYVPTVHMGPSVAHMEKKGMKTEIGNRNREIAETNKNIRGIKNWYSQLDRWSDELEDRYKDEATVARMLKRYMFIREKGRENWHSGVAHVRMLWQDICDNQDLIKFLKSKNINTMHQLSRAISAAHYQMSVNGRESYAAMNRIYDIRAIREAAETIKKYQPLKEEGKSKFFKRSKEKFKEKHAEEISKYNKASRLIHKFYSDGHVDMKALKKEEKELNRKIEKLEKEYAGLKSDIKQYQNIKRCSDWVDRYDAREEAARRAAEKEEMRARAEAIALAEAEAEVEPAVKIMPDFDEEIEPEHETEQETEVEPDQEDEQDYEPVFEPVYYYPRRQKSRSDDMEL